MSIYWQDTDHTNTMPVFLSSTSVFGTGHHRKVPRSSRPSHRGNRDNAVVSITLRLIKFNTIFDKSASSLYAPPVKPIHCGGWDFSFQFFHAVLCQFIDLGYWIINYSQWIIVITTVETAWWGVRPGWSFEWRWDDIKEMFDVDTDDTYDIGEV